MEKTGVVKLAKVLKALVTVTFVCNIAVLFLVPGLAGIRGEGGMTLLREAMAASPLPGPLIFLAVCWQYLWRVWRSEYAAVLAAFLLLCGTCTAVILWQARRVLRTIIRGSTFVMENARSMRRAAGCCFLVSAAALGRTVWGFFFYGSVLPLLTYNALFCPLFLMGGLLCMVMSALFRQAAELKAENDLTI